MDYIIALFTDFLQIFHPLGNQQVNFGSQKGSEVSISLKCRFFEPEKIVSSNPNLILREGEGQRDANVEPLRGFLACSLHLVEVVLLGNTVA